MSRLLHRRSLEVLKNYSYYFSRKITSMFPEMHLAKCSKLFANVPCVQHDGLLFFEVLYKAAESCDIYNVHVGSAGSEPCECSGEIELN